MDKDIQERLYRYASAYSEEESPLLQKIHRETHLEIYQPNMLSGHLQGRLLSLFSKLLQPKTIVEIGTFTGYATLCLAEGLAKGGVIHTIELNDELEERCLNYFEQSDKKEAIHLHIGDAVKILPQLPPPIDLVFIDADKPNYETYLDLVIEKVRKGGLIIVDNVFFHGQVLRTQAKQSKNAQAIVDFNQKIKGDKRISPLLLPFRDGLFILEKKG